MNRHRIRQAGVLLVLPLLLLPALCACRSTGDFFDPRTEFDRSGRFDRGETTEELDRAESELDEGSNQRALERLLRIREIDGIDGLSIRRTELLLERGAVQRLNQLIDSQAPADDFEDLFEDDVSKRVRVSAGILAGRRELEQGEFVEAYEWVRRVDAKFTSHHERAAAGNILAEAGFALAESDESVFFFFSARDRAPEVLEYLVLNYPSNRNGEQAYIVLAELYEDDDEGATALERLEDLRLYYPKSPLVPNAAARIPALRLELLIGAEYDRAEIERAEAELREWLARYSGHELEPSVLATLKKCRGLQLISDLSIAAFYLRVDKHYGARFHADRALQIALQIGDEEGARQASQIIADAAPLEASAALPEDRP